MAGRGETELLHHGGRAGRWGSLGWWDGTPGAASGDGIDYHAACTALARRVAQAAGLAPGDRVLSVACGEGEELRLWVQHFGAGAVVGVELDAARAQRAAAAAAAWPAVRVMQGSGTDLPRLGLPASSFDRVLCVDAAYHLWPRTAFLRAAHALLRPGGTLAYTDLVLDGAPAGWQRAALTLAARTCGLAPGGLQHGATHLQHLADAGFTAAALQRCDEPVLGGFSRFVRRQGPRLPGGAWQPGWRRVALTAMGIPPCRAAGLGYAMLSATKPLDCGAGAAAAHTAAATPSAERTALSSSGTPSSA